MALGLAASDGDYWPRMDGQKNCPTPARCDWRGWSAFFQRRRKGYWISGEKHLANYCGRCGFCYRVFEKNALDMEWL